MFPKALTLPRAGIFGFLVFFLTLCSRFLINCFQEFKWCSRCKIVRYCSKTCQQSDFDSHKNDCKKVSALTKKVDVEFAKLQNLEGVKNEPEDRGDQMFRVNLGSFSYDSFDELPNEYIKAVDTLVKRKWLLLKKFDSWQSYQVNQHFL
jgi:hypothetical protein